LADRAARAGSLPRWLVVTSYPLGALTLTLFFIYLSFPYDLVVARFSQPLESSTGMRILVGDVGPHLSLLGPGLEVRDVQAKPQAGRIIAVDRIFVRPAWSLSWFVGRPALYIDLASDLGSVDATIELGSRGSFDGELLQVQVAALPIEKWFSELDFAGVLDATVDLAAQAPEDGGGLVGLLHFDLRDGSVAGPGLPLALPFENFGGNLLFGEEGTFVRLDGVALEGPMIAATVIGQVRAAPSAAGRLLDIGVDYQILDPGLVSMLGSGGGQLKVGGTIARPTTTLR
jgi:type II secretion system protein N